MLQRRDFLKWLGAAAGAGALAGRGEPAAGNGLNVVFILVDDLGWRDLGCFGSSFYETPNIDRLCARGMRFTSAYAACPVCSPTRASILTGKYPARLRLTDFLVGKRTGKLLPAPYVDRLPLDETTLAEALREAGYATFFAGKWHLGPQGYWPEDQGFDTNQGGCDRGGPYGGGKYFSPYANPRLADGPPGEHLPDRLATETCRFIQAQGERPFLAYLSFYSVHTPLMARPDLRAKYERKAATLTDRDTPARRGQERARQVRLVQDHAVYAGMVEAVDQAVGKVVDAVEQAGVSARTAFVFMSDNGGLSTSEGSPTANVPLRAGKGWLYEGGIREPMFIVWPGVAAPGSDCNHPVTSTDFYPTLLEMAGLQARPEQHLDGVSMAPLLRGAGMAERPLFWHYPHYGNQGGAPSGAVRAGAWKLIEWFEDDSIELFNLEEDLGEGRNLAAAEPERAAALRQRLHDWRRQVGAAMPSPNPNHRPEANAEGLLPGSRDREFEVLRQAAVDASELGYALRTARGQTGQALQRLPQPPPDPCVLKVALRTMAGQDDATQFRNGFLVFGDGGAPGSLIRAGVYLGGRRYLSLHDASQASAKAVEVPLPGDANRTIDLEITVDRARRRVRLTEGEQTITLELQRDLGPLTHVGFAAINTTTGFGPVRIAAPRQQ